MAVREHRQVQEFGEARGFLAAQGIVPDAAGRYDFAALEAGIRARGWEATVEGKSGDWVAGISEQLGPTEFRSVVASGSDRADALLRALDAAVQWLVSDNAHRHLDDQARELMGISGEEFRHRWQGGEFADALDDLDHPDHAVVGRLATLMSVGW